MTKKVFNLWLEVKLLRREVKKLDFKLSQANASIEMYRKLLDEERKGVSLLAFTVPQSTVFMSLPSRYWQGDLKADASYANFREQELTSKMKIQMFDELLEKGFIKKYEPDNSCTRYEINVVRR